MKTKKVSTKQVPPKLVKINASSLQNSASSTTERSISKTRNFGWLVTGMFGACQPISI